MLKCLDEFRKQLDDAMMPSMKKRTILYGYGYTGRFLKWYAEYYHGIQIDYIITDDWSSSIPYDQELFRPTFFEFSYKDAADCIVWMALPYAGQAKAILERERYAQNQIIDFYSIIYGEDIQWKNIQTDAFHQRKTGIRDIQFLEWLEWKYDCNFVTRVDNTEFERVKIEDGAPFVTNTQKELFEIMDKVHYRPRMEDAVLDLGCGKGGAMLSFLDYGFYRVGGVEYEPALFSVLQDNLAKLKMSHDKNVECICNDASKLTTELDSYNWFYFFSPFYGEVFGECIKNIVGSLDRRPRKVWIIYINPHERRWIEVTGRFRLFNQITFTSRQRVVNVYESI